MNHIIQLHPNSDGESSEKFVVTQKQLNIIEDEYQHGGGIKQFSIDMWGDTDFPMTSKDLREWRKFRDRFFTVRENMSRPLEVIVENIVKQVLNEGGGAGIVFKGEAYIEVSIDLDTDKVTVKNIDVGEVSLEGYMEGIDKLDGERLFEINPVIDIAAIKKEVGSNSGVVDLAYTCVMDDVYGGGYTRAGNISPNSILFEIINNYDVDWITHNDVNIDTWEIGESGMDVLAKQELDYVYQDIFVDTYMEDDEILEFRKDHDWAADLSDEEINSEVRRQVYDDTQLNYGI